MKIGVLYLVPINVKVTGIVEITYKNKNIIHKLYQYEYFYS